MKVLWFSNKRLTETDIKSSGSWLISMSSSISKEIELYNITQVRGPNNIRQYERNGIKEWVLPHYHLRNGLPSKKHINEILSIIKEIKPDVIHIWGTESYWGLLPFENCEAKVLLDIQGVLYACYDMYLGGLNVEDFFCTQNLIDALYSYFYIKLQKYRMGKRAKYERAIINKINNISYQSEWVLNKLKAIHFYNKNYIETRISVRKEFFDNVSTWKYGHYNRLVTVVSPQSYKGIHTTIKAFWLVHKVQPTIRLSIIGNIKGKSGYPLFINALINKLDLADFVDFRGALNANEMINEFLKSDCIINSSYVESYSLVMAESMMIGIPSVVSFSGAMVELAKNEESALFYTPGDYVECSSKVMRIIQNKDVASFISANASKMAYRRNDILSASQKQLNIYNTIVG